MKISELNPNKKNPRKITDRRLEMLKTSVFRYGDLSGFVYNQRTKTLISGHQKQKTIPPDSPIKIEKRYDPPTRSKTVAEGYVLVDGERFKYREVDADPTWETEAMLAANKHGGEWDNDILKDVLANTPNLNIDFAGFELPEIAPLNIEAPKYDPEKEEKPKEEKKEVSEEIPEPPKEPKAKLGDLFQLGPHKILCADSTDTNSWLRLMAGKKADLVFTDPPYNINYCPEDRPIGGRARSENKLGNIENDQMTDENFLEFLKAVNKSILEIGKPGMPIYQCAPIGMNNLYYLQAWKEAGFHYSDGLVWFKNNHSISRKDYHPKHEIIHYGWLPGSHKWYGQRDKFSVFECARESVNNYQHPTQKPVPLVEFYLKNSSLKDDIVVDLFLGSGSTLMACEKLDRVCFGMEIDPAYVDVIVNRWETYTGKKAEKLT